MAPMMLTAMSAAGGKDGWGLKHVGVLYIRVTIVCGDHAVVTIIGYYIGVSRIVGHHTHTHAALLLEHLLCLSKLPLQLVNLVPTSDPFSIKALKSSL